MTGTMDATDAPAAAGQDYSTGRLARMVTDTRFEDLPDTVVAATRRLILDEIVVTAAAYETPMARTLYRLRGADRGGAAEATLIVDGRKVPAANAAYIHAQLANVLDADETMHNRMHTVSASVMAGLAVAESTGASGKELITAIATGYEITARVGTSLKQWVPDGRGGLTFAPLFGFSWMTLGAAATTGRLLGLDSPGVARALGQAFVSTPVYFDIEGRGDAWHKYQMSGICSAAGVEAALLVADGWLAREDVLDEAGGFWKSFAAPGCDLSVLYSDIGSRWRIVETSFKPYPFCRFGHGALDVMTDLVAEHGIRADDIDRIDLRIPPHSLSKKLATLVHPGAAIRLLHSLPTALALIASRVPPGPQWFNRDFDDPQLRGLAERVHHEVVEEWGPVLGEQMDRDGFFSRIPTEVAVWTTSGEEYRGYSEYALGDPWAPDFAFGDEQVAAKARQYLDGLLPKDQIDRLIDATLSLDSAGDVSAVARAMVARDRSTA